MAVLETLLQGPPLTVRMERRGAITIVTLDGSCTMEVSASLRDSLEPLVQENAPSMVIDLRRLDFVDSTGLGGLIAAHLRARQLHGVIRLVAPQQAIREVLTITWLVKLFPIDDSVEAAVAALGQQQSPAGM